jgi:hypothetical protein
VLERVLHTSYGHPVTKNMVATYLAGRSLEKGGDLQVIKCRALDILDKVPDTHFQREPDATVRKYTRARRDITVATGYESHSWLSAVPAILYLLMPVTLRI